MSPQTVLILTVGGSPDPVRKSIEQHKPNFIYFVPSKLTEDLIDKENLANIAERAALKQFVVADPNSLMECYKACLMAFEDIRKLALERENIIVDPTGGTKLMSAALLLAAGDLGIKISYVGGEARNKEGVGTVISGSEKIIYSAHPFDFTSRSLREQFSTSFNYYRFDTALNICQKIVTSGSTASQKIFRALEKICEGYRDWDLFRYKSVTHHLEKGLNELRRLSTQYGKDIEILSPFMKSINDNLNDLQSRNLTEETDDNVAELLGNADRRYKEGKYDDAVARLYRALELAAQVEFRKTFAHGTKDFPVDKLPEASRKRLNLYPIKDGRVDIGCQKAFEILFDMGNERGKRYKEYEKQVRDILQRRNSSILAHGLQPLDKKDFESLREKFKEIYGPTLRIINFPQLEPEGILNLGLWNYGNE